MLVPPSRQRSRLGTAAYRDYSQLAQWNGEGARSDPAAARAHWARTSRFVWVRGTEDTVVYPNEGEQWGALTGAYPANKTVVPMQQTAWYIEDAFGLKTADAAGKHAYEQFEGNHIRFTIEELYAWLAKYFARG